MLGTTLQLVADVVSLERRLSSVAPLGEALYRELVDNYAFGAAAAIRRWGA